MAENEKTTLEEEMTETDAEKEAVGTPEEKPEPTELEKAEAALKEANDKYLRLAAEYDNYRKRTAKEKEVLYNDSTAAAAGAFLGVYDNLERALATPCADEGYKKGVELIFTEFCNTLSKLKVEIIDPAGEAFDPNFHNAVMHEENEDFGENTVSEVFQKGAKLGDRVVRPAMVKVAN
ncbi:MAG: nucleotide exchange factor GrpE [Oscillospiraceae bacterium]|nr:nucleotide exchange factor GrpE [Oscillospiraceae bacterium]MBQ3224326.1 nucleotide exchange factor GrpE [Oscillospiraceae bacterium]MBQ6697717.1 nucleotide exchange factor GrpE [Oscillospiraceae bacterium]MBQ7053596.1 nucleotide exchange factor GrpE [Oscillospiraceae bacterium]